MRLFSTIYVEQKALEHEKTKQILAHFPNSTVIKIAHYKDVFNQPFSDFRAQKDAMALILAVKEDNFIYKGSQYADGFGFEQFYYTPTMLNCLYDCHYCYLQGMYNSGHAVVFVNIEDFLAHTLEYLDKPMLVCTSYDTDLLAVENFIGHNEAFLDFAANHKNMYLEIRTKSSNIKSIAHIKPMNTVVLAWTISPQSVIDTYEAKTPSLAKRLKAINQAIDLGWQVRLCMDPLIYIDDFVHIYQDFIDEVFSKVDATKVYEVTTGTFRMSSAHLKRIKKMHHTPLAFYPYEVRDGMALYAPSIDEMMVRSVHEKLKEYIDDTSIRIWKP